MDKKLIDFMVTKTQELVAAPSCSPALKKAAQEWLDAADKEAATPAYVEALKQGVSTIDELLGFAGSDTAAKVLGTDAAAQLLDHAKDLKASGAKFCDCPACTPSLAILREVGAL